MVQARLRQAIQPGAQQGGKAGAVQRLQHHKQKQRRRGKPQQALYSAGLAALLSAGLYGLAQSGLNHLFVQMPGEYASHLLARHYALALVAVLGVSAVAAACGGWRVARIQACEGIRDV